MKPLETVLE